MSENCPHDCQASKWKESRKDPVREELLSQGKEPDFETISALFSATTGAAAFDQTVINGNIERLKTVPEVNTGCHFLDLSVKTGLAFIDATFQGDHPKYGVKVYGENCHDGFPPTIIAAVDALSAWGLNLRARQIFRYWILNLIHADGTIDYYGPSISEYGQLLHTAACLEERAGIEGWWHDCFPPLDRLADHLLKLRTSAEKDDGLIVGSPEADERKEFGKYFHNNAWAAKGLQRWADLCERRSVAPSTAIDRIRNTAKAIEKDTLEAIRKCWPDDPADWWLTPRVEPLKRPQSLTDTREASYTNYRYWPELLSSGVLPNEMANRIVDARLSAGGQFCGMTRFADWLDDWPLADYLYGLWDLGRKRDFLLSLYGHIAYHQAKDHLTAYEQVTFPPGKEKAAYSLPCQLVAARAARLLVK
ncbi:MAG: hypothetical protein KKE37_06825 [Verrucomicrobia bacterium]|nr:hypothetical protein [Verrucomicrobiota bacterium]MBU4291745.1 hypothetical protein [Verrucomicrobiota bacterium]MBU4429051.1 hypothetical protein [Verrucomicrobiota bacterium]MCG2679335.1 hypothetical protein [Kiritimatiellia bacterium]